MASRIPFQKIDPEVLKRATQLQNKPLHLHQLLANQPQLLSAWIDFAYALRWNSKTPRRLRELMILRGAQICQCQYEWNHHVRMGQEAGISIEEIQQIENWKNLSSLSDTEKTAIEFMEAVLKGKVDDPLSNKMLQIFTPAEYVELTLTAGFYSMVPRVLDALQVEYEVKPGI